MKTKKTLRFAGDFYYNIYTYIYIYTYQYLAKKIEMNFQQKHFLTCLILKTLILACFRLQIIYTKSSWKFCIILSEIKTQMNIYIQSQCFRQAVTMLQMNSDCVARHGMTWGQTISNRQEGQLTHWGRVTHICVGKLTIIGSDIWSAKVDKKRQRFHVWKVSR